MLLQEPTPAMLEDLEAISTLAPAKPQIWTGAD